MPNWCDNYIEITGNPKTLKKYFDDVKKQQKIQQAKFDGLTEEQKMYHDLSNEDWVRNLFPHLTDKEADQAHRNGEINIRGTIIYFELKEKDLLVISADTAWNGTVEGLNNYLLNNYKDICVSNGYEAEMGMCSYIQYKSNESAENMININLTNEEEDIYYSNYGDELDLLDDINCELNTKYQSIDELKKAEEKKGTDIEIDSFDVVSLPQCEPYKEVNNEEIDL